MGSLLVLMLLVPRPVLSGPAEQFDTRDGSFKIHYTRSGADAPRLDDGAPKNGVPDDVDVAADGLSRMMARWVDGAGMRRPLPDLGEGGDGRIDVYVRRLPGPRGMAYFEPAAGEAPPRATSALLELDPRTALLSRERLAAAAAHEGHHAVQYAYSTTLAHFIEEACATYVEHVGFGDAALSVELERHWAAVLDRPAVSLDTADGVREYDQMVFAKFLVDATKKGDPALAILWDRMAAAGDALSGIEAYAGMPIASVLHQFAAWNLRACDGPGAPNASRYVPEARCVERHPPAVVGLGAVPSFREVPLPPLSFTFVGVPAETCMPVNVRFEKAFGVAFGAAGLPRLAVGDAAEIEVTDGATPVLVARGRAAPGDGPLGVRLAPSLQDAGCAPLTSDAGLPAKPLPSCSTSITKRTQSNLYWIVFVASWIAVRRRRLFRD